MEKTKAKITILVNISKIYNVLKASNGKTAARIKKISENKKRTTTVSIWSSAFSLSRGQNNEEKCTAPKGER